jgi:hypothetical protein
MRKHPWTPPTAASLPARLFYRLHRFYWVGITVGLWVGRGLRLRCHRLRDLMIAVDVALSGLFLLGLLAAPPAVVLSIVWLSPTPALVALAVNLANRGLLRLEQGLGRRHWLKQLSLYAIDIGSARTLHGRVAIWHLFVNTGPRFWTKTRVARAMERAARATGWLEAQAGAYGVSLQLENQPLPGRLALPPPPADPVQALYARLTLLALALAASTAGFDGVCLVVHLSHPITSFALPAYLGIRQPLAVECCVLGCNVGPEVHAHELLHLFGAADHYYCSGSLEWQAKEELIGRSIMFAPAGRALSDLVVDGVTAQSVGWL